MKLLPLKSLFLTRQVCNSRKSKHFIKTVCYGKKQETGEQLYTVTQKGNILLKNTQITNMEILGNFHWKAKDIACIDVISVIFGGEIVCFKNLVGFTFYN